MLALLIILGLVAVLAPMSIILLPFILSAGVNWPELPPEEEHYISPPAVIFKKEVHSMFTREGNTERVCLCDECHVKLMLSLQVKKPKVRKDKPTVPIGSVLPRNRYPRAATPPPLPQNPDRFDYSDC